MGTASAAGWQARQRGMPAAGRVVHGNVRLRRPARPETLWDSVDKNSTDLKMKLTLSRVDVVTPVTVVG